MNEDLEKKLGKLERENRILKKKLDRSEKNRAIMEESKDRFDRLYQSVIEDVKNQKELFQQIIDFLPDATFVIDNEGNVIAWNQAMQELTGIKAEEMLEKGDHAYAIPFHGEKKQMLIDLVRLKEWDESYEKAYLSITRKKDGTFITESFRPELREGLYLSTTARELLDAAGQPSGAIESIRDITPQKKAEQELQNKFDELTEARWAMLNILEDIDVARKTTEKALEVISSSINYASHIQHAILPDEQLFKDWFNDYFVVWEPRDVVGGDIYWSVPWNNGLLLALGDCTGHGVPGAFMTLITTAALSRARNEINMIDIPRVVQRMHQIVQKSLGQNEEGGISDDGMELGLCYFNADMTELTYVGTRFPLFIAEDGKVDLIKGDKKAIGYRSVPYNHQYTEHRIPIKAGQRYYLTTDGLIDQIGGHKRRSYGKKRFKNVILSLADVPFAEHGSRLYQDLVAYQGKESRRDDISLFGFQI